MKFDQGGCPHCEHLQSKSAWCELYHYWVFFAAIATQAHSIVGRFELALIKKKRVDPGGDIGNHHRYVTGAEGMTGVFAAQAMKLLESADVRPNGGRPWDIQINDDRVWRRAILGGSLGFGEAYMDGWFDCPAMDQMFERMFGAGVRERLWALRLFKKAQALHNMLVNRQSPKRAGIVAETHYDVGNDLFARMLDPLMIYSCGYWQGGANDLAEAQKAKLDLIARKLELQPGMKVLDIGCGWGGAAYHMAQRYGVSVVGVTISKEQAALAQERVDGLDVEIRLQDYREVAETFDAIYSIGMFEHVGARNYREYFEVARRCLAPRGRFLLHTIGDHRADSAIDPWIDRYIFPNGHIPSATELAQAAEPQFVIEDWHNFGPDYDKTLMAWMRNFEAAYPDLDHDRYDERFRRMWVFYLSTAAAGFRVRANQLWQVLLGQGDRTDIPVWR